MCMGYLILRVGEDVVLGLKPELALNKSFQACCYDYFDASLGDMMSLQRAG